MTTKTKLVNKVVDPRIKDRLQDKDRSSVKSEDKSAAPTRNSSLKLDSEIQRLQNLRFDVIDGLKDFKASSKALNFSKNEVVYNIQDSAKPKCEIAIKRAKKSTRKEYTRQFALKPVYDELDLRERDHCIQVQIGVPAKPSFELRIASMEMNTTRSIFEINQF